MERTKTADKKKAPPKVKKRISKEPLPPKKRGVFTLTPNFFVFCAIWVFSLIFTQALRSPLSSVLFIFVTLLPYVSLAYLIAARAAVEAAADTDFSEAVKRSPVEFKVTVSNRSPLPMPFVEADILVPNEDAVRCRQKRMYLALSPRGRYEIRQTVAFSYRGQYDIGVSDLYVYDFFRMFRIKKVEDRFRPVFVLPRRMILDSFSASSASDVNTESMKNVRGIDRAEMSDVREYRMGDHMKTIHWKLSSKTQELQVKEYAMNSGKVVYIFCDLAARYDTADEELYADDINEYAADGVIEIAIAAAMREVKSGNVCKLIWYDSRVPGGTQVSHMESPEDLERDFRTFATAELCSKNNDVAKLSALISETQGVTLLFVTARLDGNLLRGMTEASAFFNNVSSSGAVELYYFNPENRIKNVAERRRHNDFAENCKLQLISSAVRVAEVKL